MKKKKTGKPVKKPLKPMRKLLAVFLLANKKFLSGFVFGGILNKDEAIKDYVNFVEPEYLRFVRKASDLIFKDIESGLKIKLFEQPKKYQEITKFVKENVKLIRSIPEQYFEKIEKAILDFNNGTLDIPLEKRLKNIYNMTNKKAKLIARDQTSKLTSIASMAKYEDLGIKSYIWKTAEDERVVGNKEGLYPEGNKNHEDHFKRNGKEFLISSPPSDGHPGMAILCRCVALPVIN